MRPLSAACRMAARGSVETVARRSVTRRRAYRGATSVPGRIGRHRGEHAERAALPTEDGAPEPFRIVREDVVGNCLLDDPRAFLELAVELTGPPARIADVDACSAELADGGRIDLGRKEADRLDDERVGRDRLSLKSASTTTADGCTGPPTCTAPMSSARSASSGSASSTDVSDDRFRTTPSAPSSECSPTSTTVRQKFGSTSAGPAMSRCPRSDSTVVSSPHGRCRTRDPARRAAAGLPGRGSLRGRRDVDPRSGRGPGSHPERVLLRRPLHAPAHERRALVRRAVHARRGHDGRSGGAASPSRGIRGTARASGCCTSSAGASGRCPTVRRCASSIRPLRRSRPLSAFSACRASPPGTGCYVLGEPAEGDTVFVSGAAGAVGSAAGQMARIAGCRVIGSAGSAEKLEWLRELGFDDVFDYNEQRPRTRPADLAPDGIDVYFDNVGGDHLEAAIGALRTHGRIVACGSISRYNDAEPSPGPRNMFLVVTKRLRIQGYIITDHYERFGEFAARRAGWVHEGRLAIARRSSRGSRTRRGVPRPACAARTSGRCSSRSARTSEAAVPSLRPSPATSSTAVLPHRAVPALRALWQAHSAARSLTASQREGPASGRPLWYETRAWAPTIAAEWGGDCALRGAAPA